LVLKRRLLLLRGSTPRLTELETRGDAVVKVSLLNNGCLSFVNVL